MENELKNLKPAMNETVLQDATFGTLQKHAIQEKLHVPRKQKFPLVGVVAVAALFIVALLVSQYFVTTNQTTTNPDPTNPNAIIEPHIFETMIFQGQTNPADSFHFLDNTLTIYTDPAMNAIKPWTDPEDVPEEGASEITYENIFVEREGSHFTIYSDETSVLTLIQTGPRLFEDVDGNVYATQTYVDEVLENEVDIKIVSSEKNLPSNFREIAVERKEVPNYLYLVNRVSHLSQYEEIWTMFNLEQQIPTVIFEKNDIYFIGVQESGSCPYELENIKMSITEEVMYIHLSEPDGPCTLDATARTFVIEVNKESSKNLKNVVINQFDAETIMPITEGK